MYKLFIMETIANICNASSLQSIHIHFYTSIVYLVPHIYIHIHTSKQGNIVYISDLHTIFSLHIFPANMI